MGSPDVENTRQMDGISGREIRKTSIHWRLLQSNGNRYFEEIKPEIDFLCEIRWKTKGPSAELQLLFPGFANARCNVHLQTGDNRVQTFSDRSGGND